MVTGFLFRLWVDRLSSDAVWFGRVAANRSGDHAHDHRRRCRMDSTPFFLESMARLLERFGLGLSDRTSLSGVSKHVGHRGPSRQSDGQVASEGSRCDRASESPRHDRTCCKASCREDSVDRCAILGPTLDASARARDPSRRRLLDGSRSDVASGPGLALGQAPLWAVRCALASPNIAERAGT